MAKKLFSVKSKITALALCVLLLIGTVPIQVSAAKHLQMLFYATV